jgi:hypothetical protein
MRIVANRAAGRVGRALTVLSALAVVVGCQRLQWEAAPQRRAVSNADGRLEFFRPRGDDVDHAWQVVPDGGWAAGSLPPLAGGSGDVEEARNADGRLEVFRATYGQVWHAWQDGPGDGWSRWASLDPLPQADHPTSVTSMDVAVNADGRLEVFAGIALNPLGGRGTPREERMVHAWQVTPGGGWSPWAFLDDAFWGPYSWQWIRDVVVGRNADGRLEVFVAAHDSSPRHALQTTPGGGWSGWSSLPGLRSSTRLAVAPNADGRLEVFGNDGHALSHAWQVAPNGTWEGGFLALLPVATSPVYASAVVAAPNVDGRLEVFTTAVDPVAGPDGDQVVTHIWQVEPNGPRWSALTAFPPVPAPLAGSVAVTGVGAHADGRLELSVDQGGDGPRTFHTWQTSPGGGWHAWQARVA